MRDCGRVNVTNLYLGRDYKRVILTHDPVTEATDFEPVDLCPEQAAQPVQPPSGTTVRGPLRTARARVVALARQMCP